jgi:hypothetical protein
LLWFRFLEISFVFVDDNPCHPPPVSIPSLHFPSSSHSNINGNPKTKFGTHNNSDDDDEEEEVTASPKKFKISLTQQKPRVCHLCELQVSLSYKQKKRQELFLPSCELSIFLSHSQ